MKAFVRAIAAVIFIPLFLVMLICNIDNGPTTVTQKKSEWTPEELKAYREKSENAAWGNMFSTVEEEQAR